MDVRVGGGGGGGVAGSLSGDVDTRMAAGAGGGGGSCTVTVGGFEAAFPVVGATGGGTAGTGALHNGGNNNTDTLSTEGSCKVRVRRWAASGLHRGCARTGTSAGGGPLVLTSALIEGAAACSRGLASCPEPLLPSPAVPPSAALAHVLAPHLYASLVALSTPDSLGGCFCMLIQGSCT